MKDAILFMLMVLLLPVLFPLAIVGGWMFTIDKNKAKQEMAQ